MANEEQVALLKQGVSAWNEWRYVSPYFVPDLIDASALPCRMRMSATSMDA